MLTDQSTPLHLAFKELDETKELKSIHKLLIYGADIEALDNM